MSLEKTLKDLISDVEKLKASDDESGTLDEIINFSETLSIVDTSVVNTNQESLAETISIADVPAVNTNQESLAETITISDELSMSDQAAGTFKYGSAKYGFASYT